MTALHLVPVCHTELGFGGGWTMFETVQPQIESVLQRVADRTGRMPRMTYLVTNTFLTERLDDAFRFVEQGHEVGIHSHIPGAHRPRHRYSGRYAYRFDGNGVLNQDAVAGPLRQLAIALGLPAPATHVSGMFTFQKTTIDVLTHAGFSVDCSLLPGVRGTHEASGDFVLADNTRRTTPHPYRRSCSDPWADGDAPLIELPVSANLGAPDIDQHADAIHKRLNSNRAVDVFQTYWHHFEFVKPGPGDLEGVERFLTACAMENRVVFSTAKEAATAMAAEGL